MATTRISDVIVPEVFNRYMVKDTMEKARIFQSGILRSDASLSSFLAGGGLTVNVPFWRDLEDATPNIATDNPADVATPGKVTASAEIAIRNVRTMGWSAARLTAELAGSDPMGRIRSRVSEWWNRHFEKTVIRSLNGVVADNVANDDSDMVVTIGTDASGAPSDAELISAEAILDTKQTMGDAADSLTLLIMHSVQFTRLQKLNLIDFIPDSEGHVHFPSYLGYKVLVDDSVNIVTGTNRTRYYTYLVGAGALAWGEASVPKPVAIQEEEDQGNGMGVETLWTRRQYILHPYGFKWTDATRTGQFPSDAEIARADNWDRVAPERKQVPIAVLISN